MPTKFKAARLWSLVCAALFAASIMGILSAKTPMPTAPNPLTSSSVF